MIFSITIVPNQPGINGSHTNIALTDSLLNSRYIINNPFYFSCRKICIDDQPCFLAYWFCVTLCLKFITNCSRSPALPYYRIAYRFSCILIPQHCCFSLVGYSNCSNLIWCNMGFFHYIFYAIFYAGQVFHGIMLNPAGIGKILCYFFR